MKRFSCLSTIIAMVALVAACGTDDTAGGQANNNPSDAGSDAVLADVGADSGQDGGELDGGPGEDTSPDAGPDVGPDVSPDVSPDADSGQICASDEDCSAPKICAVDRSGDSVEKTCQDPNAGGAELGDTCSDDADCAANLCVDGQCSRPCERPADCSDDGSFICDTVDIDLGSGDTASANVCVARPAEQCTSDADCNAPQRCIATKGSDAVTFECGAPNDGGGAIGDTCSDDADCAQNLCRSGQCTGPCAADGDCSAGDDFSCAITPIELGNGNTDNAQVCEPPRPCSSADDCRIDEVCRVDRSTGEAACGPENAGGGGLGDICTDDQGCAANICHDGRFREVCSVPCADDGDCAETGYECQTTAVDDGSGAANDVSVCVATDPTNCSSNDDCPSGSSCAIVPNEADDALESVCVPSSGGKAAGVPCSADDECASLVCREDVCSGPCSVSDQCGNNQLCQTGTVTKDSLSGDFDICERLVDERCDQTGTCSDAVRICNQVRLTSTNPDVNQGFCGMPNPQAPGSLKDHCEQSTDCRSRLCQTAISDECSVICANDGQCASGQICATFALDTSQLGFCTSACTDNAGCTGLDYTDANGDAVDHVCTINGNSRDDDIDQICARTLDTGSGGQLGDSCQDGGDCQTGMCLTNTLFRGVSCNSAFDCDAGQVCEISPGGGKECGDQDLFCTRICDDGGDCSGGVSGNQLTACDSDIAVTLPSGATDTISACATP